MAQLACTTPTTVASISRACTYMTSALGSARGTRLKAWRSWRTCLTWAAGRGRMHRIPQVPMDHDTLLAVLWDFTAMGTSRSTRLKSIIDAVTARHRDEHLPSPVSGPAAHSRFTRCLGRLLGTQHPHKMGVTRDTVVRLLRYRPRNLLESRNNIRDPRHLVFLPNMYRYV